MRQVSCYSLTFVVKIAMQEIIYVTYEAILQESGTKISRITYIYVISFVLMDSELEGNKFVKCFKSVECFFSVPAVLQAWVSS